MSHVATVDVDIRDLVALKAACTSLGLVLAEGQKTYHCWGTGKSLDRLRRYQTMSGKQLMPDGFTLSEMGRCEHAIRVPGTHGEYEIGLAKRKDGRSGYLLMCDLSGAHDIKARAGDDLGKLRQGYAVEVAVRAAKRAGFRVISRTIRSDGSVALTTQR